MFFRFILLISALLLLAGLVLAWVSRHATEVMFEGEMWLRPGTTSSTALAAHNANRRGPDEWSSGAGTFYPGRALHQLPISQEAKALLPTEPLYDAVVLPFDITLRDAQIVRGPVASDAIVVQRGGDVERLRATPGTTVTIAGSPMEVAGVEPWGGLLRDPSGRPMAAVAVRLPGRPWVENIFLESGEWVRVGDDLGLLLVWADESARGAAEAPPEQLDARRWGVVEGRAIHWLSSFEPGTSVALRDGRTVSAEGIAVAPGAAPELVVTVEGNSMSESRRVPANEWDENSEIRFEDWGLLNSSVVLRASTIGHAQLALYARGSRIDYVRVDVGTAWDGPSGLSIRLDQLESKALPLPVSQSPLHEITLRTPDGEIRIRQGESARWGSSTLAYERKLMPGESALRVRVTSGNEVVEHELLPGESAWQGPWQLSPAPGGTRADGYTIRARLIHTGAWMGWLGGAMAATAVALSVLAVMRRRRRRVLG